MDDKHLGITWEEAEAVIQNIRERHRQGHISGYLDQFGRRHATGNGLIKNHGWSSENSPYFKPSPSNTTGMVDRSLSPRKVFRPSLQVKEKLLNQQFVSETCSIAKRLRFLKQPCIRDPHSSMKLIPSGEQPVAYDSGATEGSQPFSATQSIRNSYSSASLKPGYHGQNSDQSSTEESKKISAESDTSITSYLPKVKRPRVLSCKDSGKAAAKKQTKIPDFSSTDEKRCSGKTSITSVANMSEEQRESTKREILTATNIACTLVDVAGNTLLRPNAVNDEIKGVYIAYRKENYDIQQEQRHSENTVPASNKYRCVFLPLSVSKTDSACFEWSRALLLTLMRSDCNKVIYEAQKFVKELLQLLNVKDHSVCFQWQCFDPKIAAWLLDSDHPPDNFDALLSTELGTDFVSELGESSSTSELQTSPQNTHSDDQSYRDVLSLLALTPRMFLCLQRKKLWELFTEVEMKICPVLAAMELSGVDIDTQLLLRYGDILQKKVRKLEQQAFKIVGHPLQLSSTQQLRQILFNELQLDQKVQKKLSRTQINNYKSTSENVLKHLQEFHPLPKIILEYRHVSKLKSAYVDGILSFTDNGTLHTHWNQTGTATGRLTSANPNIQAIPKSQLDITGVTKQFIIGKEMETLSIVPRLAFKSRNGWTFLAADFQSIELRLLAHFSEDPLLLRIFNRSDDDIFVQLASLWLSLDPKSVQSEQRERAKRIVYSVIYGVGKERLAETLGVSSDEAKAFTLSFLATFPGLKKFIKNCVNQCRNQGYVTTIFGRQRLLPAINSQEQHLKSQAERQAVNFVIQGSAADICKMGMILVVRSLSEKFKLNARLLIQIHDELVLEVSDEQVENVKDLVKSLLEDTDALCAGHVLLKVNFKVSVSSGKTWAQMETL